MAEKGVGFILVAIAVAIVQAVVVVLLPWGVAFRELGLYGLFAALPLLIAIAVALTYAWLRGALEWD